MREHAVGVDDIEPIVGKEAERQIIDQCQVRDGGEGLGGGAGGGVGARKCGVRVGPRHGRDDPMMLGICD